MDDKHELTYTLTQALDDLDGPPDYTELVRLVYYYPTYEMAHRKGLLQGFFDGKTQAEMVQDKINTKVGKKQLPKQSKGGHGLWVVSKARKAVIRLLYLRYRLDQGMTKRQANQQLWKQFASSKTTDGDQSNIRNTTRSKILPS